MTLEQKRLYDRVHKWLEYNYKKEKLCTFCNSETSSRYEWALIKGCVYEKNIENFVELCVACHRQYDVTQASRKAMSLAQRNKPRPWRRKKVKAEKGGDSIEFPSIGEASKETGISRTAISNALTGRAKTAGNYCWNYV